MDVVNQIASDAAPSLSKAPVSLPGQPSLIDILHRANQLANQRFSSGVGNDAPTPRQLAVLGSVAASDGLSQTEISDATGIDRATTAEIVGRLTRMGLLRRRRTRRDARTYAVNITDEGRTALQQTTAVASEMEQALLAVLSPSEQQQLITLLNRLVAVGGDRP
jgi:DNA-binding MarR family transcriptional regulator